MTLQGTHEHSKFGTLPFTLPAPLPLAFARQSVAIATAGAGRLRFYALTAMDDFLIPTGRSFTCHHFICHTNTCHQNASGRDCAGVACGAIQCGRCCPLSRAIGGLQHARPKGWSNGIYQSG